MGRIPSERNQLHLEISNRLHFLQLTVRISEEAISNKNRCSKEAVLIRNREAPGVCKSSFQAREKIHQRNVPLLRWTEQSAKLWWSAPPNSSTRHCFKGGFTWRQHVIGTGDWWFTRPRVIIITEYPGSSEMKNFAWLPAFCNYPRFLAGSSCAAVTVFKHDVLPCVLWPPIRSANHLVKET